MSTDVPEQIATDVPDQARVVGAGSQTWHPSQMRWDVPERKAFSWKNLFQSK